MFEDNIGIERYIRNLNCSTGTLHQLRVDTQSDGDTRRSVSKRNMRIRAKTTTPVRRRFSIDGDGLELDELGL